MPDPSITSIGEALFGSRWTTELAREIGVSDRYARMLASGERPMTDAVRDEILAVARARRRGLDAVIAALS